MPNLDDRLPENVPGLFYVDSTCIDCDQCRSATPDFFRRHDDLGMSIVYRQPVSEADIERCQEALDGCPTESIGRTDA